MVEDEESASDLPKLIANKNIENTPHQYEMIVGDQAIANFIKKISSAKKEICIDTETTGIDANNVQLVGLSFSNTTHTGYYIPVANDGDGADGAKYILEKLKPYLKTKQSHGLDKI